ncbi:MAG TPA: kinase [Candidatus Merdisoma merdipullorum]|nr:kinase [Candidatus Merdisoma merdipullorum]
MESGTCLKRIRAYLEKRGWEYEYHEEDGCGSIDFSYRGVPYHIWEFEEGERGVETNLQHGGRQEEVLGDYETKLIEMIESWK